MKFNTNNTNIDNLISNNNITNIITTTNTNNIHTNDEIIFTNKRIKYYYDNPFKFPPLSIVTLNSIINKNFENELIRYNIHVPKIIPKDELNFDKMTDYEINIHKDKIKHIWKYYYYLDNLFLVSFFDYTKYNLILDQDNIISKYLNKREKEDFDIYTNFYNIAYHLLYNPNAISNNNKKLTYIDLYNNSSNTDQITINSIKDNIKNKYDYLNIKKSKDKYYFPDLKYYHYYDLDNGVFLKDKTKYKFKWPKNPKYIVNVGDLPDFSELKPIPNIWRLLIGLFHYTKKYPNNDNDETYTLKFYDDTKIELIDNSENIHDYLLRYNNYKEKKINIYNEYIKNYYNNSINNINNDLLINLINKENIIINNDIDLDDNNTNNISNINVSNFNNISNEINIINNNNINIDMNIIHNHNLNIQSNKKIGRPSQGICLCNKRYQVFIKYGYTEWLNKEYGILEYFNNWKYKVNNHFDILIWSRYKLNNNNYISFICVIYPLGGNRTYQNYLPEKFEYCNTFSKDDILLIEIGNFYNNKLEHLVEYIYCNDKIKEEHEKLIKSFKPYNKVKYV